MSEELKPCPFCGDPPGENSHELTQGFKYGAIACGCSAVGPDVRTGYEDWPAWKDAAVKAWNERAELSRLKAGQGEAVAWRDHSVNYAKGEKCPATVETLQAAWGRDQELMLDQKAEISRLKETVNQLRQKRASPPTPDATQVMVPRELLMEAAWIVGIYAPGGGSAEDFCLEELRALLAQHEGVKP